MTIFLKGGFFLQKHLDVVNKLFHENERIIELLHEKLDIALDTRKNLYALLDAFYDISKPQQSDDDLPF